MFAGKIISSFYLIIRYFRKDLEKVFAKSPASPNFGEWNEIRYCEGEACKEIFTEIFTEAWSVSRNKNIYKDGLFHMIKP